MTINYYNIIILILEVKKMKLLINYDFFNAIDDVKQPLGPIKVIRAHKYKYIFNLPMFLAAGSICGNDVKATLAASVFSYSFILSTDCLMDYFAMKILHSDVDMYADKASKRLMKLASMLKDINVRTNYDMLLQSELYERKYKVHLNDKKIPLLMEEKYVLVPSYNFSGEETETSILQEHNVGTSDYILSVGEPQKQYRRSLVKMNG